jgi:citrate lyase subunit beta/citryl-CoA lyase
VSEASRRAPRRTSLALPGSSERFLAKAPSIDADAFILDLEDAVAPSEKPGARAKIVEAVRTLDFGGRPVSVRVNGWTTRWARDDVVEVVTGCAGRLTGVVLPKAAGPGEIAELSALLDEVERDAGVPHGTTGIDALVESAIGLSRVEETVLASPRVESVGIGIGDLAAALGMPVLIAGAPSDTYPGDVYHYALFRLLVAGRAAGITVVDGPYQRLGDLDGLRAAAERTRALGFDGKWVIHPDQVPVVNDVFSPTPEEIARAEAVIAALDGAIASDGRGAIRDADEMIDEVSRKMAETVLARAHRSPPRR